VIAALAFLLLNPGPLAARPGEILLVLDDSRQIRADAVSYWNLRLRVRKVGAQHWTTFEPGNGYTYNPTTRVLTCFGCMFADNFEGTP
jgi:hypothetical protein